MRLICLRSFLICISSLLRLNVLGRLVNTTIDDQSVLLSYFPENLWHDSTHMCQSCTARPNASMAIKGTWHDSTVKYDQDARSTPNQVRNVSMMFNGTAIYVKCILAETTSSPNGNSDMSFYIDDDLVGQFSHPASGKPGFKYNVTVYSNSSIPAGMHKFTVQNGHVGGRKSLLLFDAFIYSHDDGQSDPDDPTATTTMGVGTIVGVVVALLVAVILGIIIFLLYWRRRLVLKSRNRHTVLEAFRDLGPRAAPSAITPFDTRHVLPRYHHVPPSTTSMSSFVANSNPSLRQVDKRPISDTPKRNQSVNTTPRNYQNAGESRSPVDEEDLDIWSSNWTQSEGSEKRIHHEETKQWLSGFNTSS